MAAEDMRLIRQVQPDGGKKGGWSGGHHRLDDEMNGSVIGIINSTFSIPVVSEQLLKPARFWSPFSTSVAS